MRLSFRETPVFTRRAAEVLTDEELRAVQLAILANPEAGATVAGTGGLRKIRVALPSRGRGKSYGARLLYLYVPARALVYLFYVYGKSDADDLSPAGRRALAALVRQYRQEDA